MRTALFLLVLTCTGCTTESTPETPPNIVFFLIDDLGWNDLGFMGSSYYETPNIDALAAQGMVFSNAYSNAPNCAPMRAAFMSGQYAPRHGVYTVASPARGKSIYRQLIPSPNITSLDTSIVTMAEMLKRAGYRTGHFGKWHLGNNEHEAENQGFDLSVLAWWGHKRSHFMPEGLEPAADYDGAEPGEYMADYLTDRAIQFLDTPSDAPFFMYFAHHGVHTPIQGKEALIAKYETKTGNEYHNNATYASMIESVDESVGRVLEALERRGIADNTIVVFLSDNGGYGPATNMYPLRGAKGMLYEGGIRVPMIVKWPVQIEAGTTNDTPVISIDFYPTFKSIAGDTIDQLLDGEDLMPLLSGSGDIGRDALYWHFPAYLEAYRNQKTPWRTTPAGAIRMGDYKLIEYFGEQRVELYNLTEDIGEQNDLASTMPEKALQLKAALVQWRALVNAPVPDQLNPEFDPEAYEVALNLE